MEQERKRERGGEGEREKMLVIRKMGLVGGMYPYRGFPIRPWIREL